LIPKEREDTLRLREGGEKMGPDLDQNSMCPWYAPGCFTEEKARQLRMKTMETELFHDALYHSAIASCLASDFSDRSDQ
jgi:hypothetical protein